MKKTTATLTATLGLVLGSLQAQTVPPFINYQGRVTDSAGVGLGTGTPVNRKVIFRIFDAASAGNKLWSEQHTVTISNGEFSVLLGNGIDAVYNGGTETPKKTDTPLDTVFTSAGILRYVEILVDNGDGTINTTDAPIAPRQQITSTAYSFRARAADTISSGTDLQLNGSANYGLGYYGSTRLFNGTAVDGPVLFGQGGGAVGSVNGSTKNIALQWNASGNVGLGAFYSTAKFSVAGDSIFSGDVTASRLIASAAGGHVFGAGGDSDGGLFSPGDGIVTIKTNNVERLRVDPNGNLGLGTADASSRLTVSGNAAVSGNVTGYGVIGTDGVYGGSIYTKGENGYRFNGLGDGDGGIFSPSDGTITFRTDGAERMRMSQGGNIGIGTTAPGSLLDVRGPVAAISVGTAGGSDGALYFGNGNHGVKRSFSGTNDVGLYTTAGSVYLSASGPGYASGLMINPSGNVGIGYNSPPVKLSVVTTSGEVPQLRLQNLQTYANTYWDFRVNSGNATDANLHLNSGLAGREVGSFNASSGGYAATSDRRLKQDIVPLEGMLDGALRLRPVKYRYKSAPDEKNLNMGFIAQDVESVFPVAVVERSDGMKGLTYSEIIPVAIGAIQELKKQKDAEVLTLQEENKALRVALAAESEKVKSMEAKNEMRDAKLANIERMLSDDKGSLKKVSLKRGE